MSDPLENELRMLRPAPLPRGLSARLAEPPSMENERDASSPHWPWWMAVASSAAALIFGLWMLLPDAPGSAAVVVSSNEELRDVRSLGVVNDGARRAWELVELEFVDEETLVSANGMLAMKTEITRRQLVPVELHFD